MTEPIRTFIAVPLTERVREEITGVIEQLKYLGGNVRWAAPVSLHLTLKFLGDLAPTRCSEVFEGTKTALKGFAPFRIRFSGTGAFPNLRRPRVFWVGVEDHGAMLEQIQGALEDTLAQRGFPREKRSFSPHLTIGRVRSMGDFRKLTSVLREMTFVSDEMAVDEVAVMKSDLRPTGALYTCLESYKLPIT